MITAKEATKMMYEARDREKYTMDLDEIDENIRCAVKEGYVFCYLPEKVGHDYEHNPIFSKLRSCGYSIYEELATGKPVVVWDEFRMQMSVTNVSSRYKLVASEIKKGI